MNIVIITNKIAPVASELPKSVRAKLSDKYSPIIPLPTTVNTRKKVPINSANTLPNLLFFT